MDTPKLLKIGGAVLLAFVCLPFVIKFFQTPVQPDPEADQGRVALIEQALQDYAGAMRYYPPSLEALVPRFLARIPRASTGHNFRYDPKTGSVTLPYEPATEAAAKGSKRQSGSGLTPMGDAMTGLSVQQELNY